MPIELPCLLHVVTRRTRLEVGDDAQPQGLHHGDDALGEVGVGAIVRVGQQRDFDVAAPIGEVADAIAVRIGQPDPVQQRSCRFQVVGIVDRRGLVVIGRAGIEPARIDGGERTAHQRFTQALAIQSDRHSLTEIEVPVEFTHLLRAIVRLAPAIAGEVHFQGIADGAGAELEARRRRFLGRAAQRLDIAFRLFEVGEIARAGYRLHVAIRPGREPVMHLVEIGQLVPVLVDLPVIGVAAHHDDVVRPVLHRHPCPHHRDVHVFGREGILVFVVGVVRIVFGVLGLEDMARPRAEGAIGHRIEILRRPAFLERPLDGVGVDRLQGRTLTKGLGRPAIERGDVGVHDVIVPVEHHVLGVERVAVGPFRPLDQVHGQLMPVLGPFPALGQVR